MERMIYAIRDTVALDFVAVQMYVLMVFKTDQQATRYFADAILDPKSALARHAADYELWCLGTLTDDTCEVYRDKRVVITGAQLIAAQPEPKEA